MNLSNPKLIYSAVLVVLVIIVMTVIVFGFSQADREPGNLDSFAQCLSDSGIVMYGSRYCGHCNEQKEMFGSSWEYVNSVECADPFGGQAPDCQAADIRAYPTWVTPEGEHVLGKQSFQELSELSGCPLDE